MARYGLLGRTLPTSQDRYARDQVITSNVMENPTEFRPLAPAPLAFDTQGRLWIGGTGSLIEWDGKLFGEYALPGGGTRIDFSRLIEGIAIDGDGIIWVVVGRTGRVMDCCGLPVGNGAPIEPRHSTSQISMFLPFFSIETIACGWELRIRASIVSMMGLQSILATKTVCPPTQCIAYFRIEREVSGSQPRAIA